MSEETSQVVAGRAARLVRDLDKVIKMTKSVVRLLERQRKAEASVAMSALTQVADKPEAAE